MVQVRGTVHDVSDNPDRVEKIIVRAVEPRMHGTTYITEEPTQFPVVDGVLDFNVLPGPCVVAFLRPHGATTYEKLLVPDVAEATFRECLDAAALAEEGTQSALEKVVRQIQEELNKAVPLVDEVRNLRTEVNESKTVVDGYVKDAQKSASEAASSEAKAKTSETNAKTSETNAASSAASAKSQQESAKTHFNNTVKEAEKAANSATAAKTSETNAASSASASASSASSSKDQADKSAASATQAATHRDAAKTSETNAAGSAAAAKTSETNSKQHETAAGDYAAVATTAATEAVDAMERATEVVGGDFATRKNVDDAVENLLSVDTTLATWTADAVGGRNLALGATQEPVVCKLPSHSHYRDIGEDVPLEVGQTYTFSIIIDKVSDDTHPVQVHLGTGNGRNFSRDIIAARENDVPYGKRFSITFTPTEYELEGENRTHLAWRLRNNRQETTVAYRELKVERGHAATPWTPSPEDSVQSLSEGNSLPSPFPGPDPALSLRVDNSVGTRVFMGDVMIYGDTGLRRAPTEPASVTDGEILLIRQGNTVTAILTGVTMTEGKGFAHLFQIPPGFRGEAGGRGATGFVRRAGNATVAERIVIFSHYVTWVGTGMASGGDRPPTGLTGSFSWRTSDPWPSSLPGTPA